MEKNRDMTKPFWSEVSVPWPFVISRFYLGIMIILASVSISKKDRQYSVVNCCFLFQHEINHVGVMLSKLPKLLWFSTGDPQTRYNARYSGRCHPFYGLLNNEKYQTLSDLLVGPILLSALKQQKVNCVKCVQFHNWFQLHLFLNQWRGEVWRHITTVALFLDDNKTNDDSDGKENGKKVNCLY